MKILQTIFNIFEAYAKFMDRLGGSPNDPAIIAANRFGIQKAGVSVVVAATAGAGGGAENAVSAEEVAKASAWLAGFSNSAGKYVPVKYSYGLPCLADVVNKEAMLDQRVQETIGTWSTDFEKFKEVHYKLISNLNCLPQDGILTDYFPEDKASLYQITSRYGIQLSPNATVADCLAKLPATPQVHLDNQIHILESHAEALKRKVEKARESIAKLKTEGKSIPEDLINKIENLPSIDDPKFAEANTKLQETIDKAPQAAAEEEATATHTIKTMNLLGLQLDFDSERKIYTAKIGYTTMLPAEVIKTFDTLYFLACGWHTSEISCDEGVYTIPKEVVDTIDTHLLDNKHILSSLNSTSNRGPLEISLWGIMELAISQRNSREDAVQP